MADDKLKDDLKKIASKYDNLDVKSAHYDDATGQLEMRVAVKGGPQADSLPEGVQVLYQESAADIIPDSEYAVKPLYSSQAARSLLEIDPLARQDLDLLKPSVLQDDPQAIYQRSLDYYRSKPIYGASINVLTNFASKGFENDIDDENIKTLG